MIPKCSFCEGPSIDSFSVEAGNNAEVWINLELCEIHSAENSRDEAAFEEKYSRQIDKLAAEKEVGS